MTINNYDVIIIGAGISGLSAALAISRTTNISMALVEAKKVGANNPSPLTFSAVVEKYNLDDCTKGKYSHFFFHNNLGSLVKYHFNDSPLVVLDYQKACMKLYSAIKANIEFDFIENKVVDIIQHSNQVTIKFKDGRHIRSGHKPKVAGLAHCSAIQPRGVAPGVRVAHRRDRLCIRRRP